MATALVEETQRGYSVLDAYPIDLEVTPKTGDEHLREIGAIGSLLIELIRDTCGLSGRITIEEAPDGVRVRVEPTDSHPSVGKLAGGG